MHSGYAIESEMNGQIRKDYVRHPKSSEERMNDWYCTCTYNMKSSRAENFHKISRIMQLWMPVVVYTLQRFFIRSRRFTFQISLYAFIPKIKPALVTPDSLAFPSGARATTPKTVKLRISYCCHVASLCREWPCYERIYYPFILS